MILATYKITYPDLGVNQVKNLIKHSDYLLSKQIKDKDERNKFVSEFGENWFTDESPLYESLKSGVLECNPEFGSFKIEARLLDESKRRRVSYNHLYYPGETLGDKCVFLQDVDGDSKRRKALFRCRCGNEFTAFILNVKREHTTSCGCVQAKQRGSSQFIHYKHGDLVGSCIYLRESQRYSNNNRRAVFLCKCGKEFESNIASIVSGDCKSCGCYKNALMKVINIKHNMSFSKEYSSWSKMKSRCYNDSDERYIHYGYRGISVCDRWLESFDNFYLDMGAAPSKNHSIDRIDVNGNYELSNCRWATSKQQANNKRDNIFLELNGLKMTISQWSDRLNIKPGTLYFRYQAGWNVEEILNVDFISKYNNKKFLLKKQEDGII